MAMFGFGQAMTLRTVVSLANDQFLKAVDESERKLTGFQKKMQAHSAAFTAAGTAIIGTITGMATQGIAYGSTIHDISIATGVAAEDVSALGYALEQSGGSIRDLVPALRGLSKNLYDAGSGAAGPASDAFKALGINVLDASGKIRPATQLLPELADALNKTANETDRMALAQATMGRGAMALLPMLGEGGDAMREMMKRAEEVNAVINNKTAAALDRAGDGLDDVKAAIRGASMELATVLAPAIESSSRKFAELIGQFKDLPVGAQKATVGIGLASGVLLLLAPNLVAAISLFSKLGALLAPFAISIGIVAESILGLTALVWGLGKAEEAAFDKGLRDADGRMISLGNAVGYAKNYILTMGDATRAWMMTLRDTLPLADKLASRMTVGSALQNLGLPPGGPVPYNQPFPGIATGGGGGGGGGGEALAPPVLAGAAWDDYFENFGAGVSMASEQLGGLAATTVEMFDVMDARYKQSGEIFADLATSLAEVVGTSLNDINNFGKSVLKGFARILLDMLKMIAKEAMAEALIKKLEYYNITFMEALFNPLALSKLAPIMASYGAVIAGITAVQGSLKFHGGGFPREAMVMVRPNREAIVDIPTAMRGGFGAGMLGGGSNIDVQVTIMRAEMTDPEMDGRRLGKAIGDQLKLAMARG
jgi:hypothetical protein